MRYRIMSSGVERKQSRARRLRVPAALAVAFVGTSAAVTMWYGGCHTQTDPPVDALTIESHGDADVADISDDPPVDAATADAPDGPRDAAADTPIV
jgi:hypothetical protein